MGTAPYFILKWGINCDFSRGEDNQGEQWRAR